MQHGADRRDITIVVTQAAILAAAYYVAAQLSLRLSLVESNVTPFWPPTGIAVVAFVLFGRRLWPGVAIAAFLVNLPITPSPLAAAATAAGNTLTPLIAAVLLERLGFRPQIDRLRDALAIVFPAALLSTLVSATIGAATLVASGAIDDGDLVGAWSVWWAGDAMGILVVAPFLLTLPSVRREGLGGPSRWIEALVLLVALAAVSFAALTSGYAVMFIVLPLLGWAAWRFQQAGAAPAALLVATLATWAAVTERGPFEQVSLLERMLTLQAFNASVAFASFVFAALVIERMRAREALERAANELEERVRRRTFELSEANEQLAEAHEVAKLGSWEWNIAQGVVRWSDELYRIHGYRPQSFPITLDRATELVVEADRARIEQNLERAFASGARDVPDIEYEITRPDGETRRFLGKGRLTLDGDGAPVRMVGTVQDVTDLRELERDHRIAESLQRALAPLELPVIHGLELAARYLPAGESSAAGGDWYDVVSLPDGSVGIVMGDAAGHGLDATNVMGQVRTCIRAYALEGLEPAVVVDKAHRFLRQLHRGEQMVTLLYIVLDLDSLEMQVVNAGHPAPIVRSADGDTRYLGTHTGLPLGIDLDAHRRGTTIVLEPGATILLYTDGLVDRRDTPIEEAFDRLLDVVEGAAGDHLEALCDIVIGSLEGYASLDDVAVLGLRLTPHAADRLELRIDSDPRALASVRRGLARWLTTAEVDQAEIDDIVLACSEACGNAIEHAYGLGGGSIEVSAELLQGQIVVAVRDSGRWRPARGFGRGRGMSIIDACMDQRVVTYDEGGTVLTMRRRLRDAVRR
jgi:PAS domain S-box-containing protein